MLTLSYIQNLIKEYAKSPEGKAEIKRQTGIIYTDKKNISAELTQYGEQMKEILYNHVHALIRSITPEDIIVEKPYRDADGLWRLKLSFREGSLHRESLDDNDYPEGLSNIVLLFAKGYHARDYVYGLWNTTGSKNSHWIYWHDIRSRKDRSGNDFLIQAVNEFNSLIGKDMANAELLGAYKEASENPN